jgi:hypothetical protein
MESSHLEVSLIVNANVNLPFSSNVLISDYQSVKMTAMQILGNKAAVLGTLQTLRNAELEVTTLVREGILPASVTYIIKYGEQVVEQKMVKPESHVDTIARFLFRFKFCPRFPFC